MRHFGHEHLIAVVDIPSNQKDSAHHWKAIVAMQPGMSGIRRHVQITGLVGNRKRRPKCGDAARIDDASKPFGETTDGLQRTFAVYRSSINCSSGCEVVCRCSHENILFRKCYCRAI
jgi:hypothetical protein